MSCDFNNKKFFEFIEELRKKHKNKNYNFKADEFLEYLTLHLKKDSKLRKIITKEKINLQEMKVLNTKCTGIVNLELSGTAEIKKDKVYFYINRNKTYLDLRNKIPNADADLSRNIIWHMHPWNISVDYSNNVPSFFSYEDIRISVNFPGRVFLIFNMDSDKSVLPVIYVVCADKDVKKNKAKSEIKDVYREVYHKLTKKNYTVDFKEVQERLKSVGVNFHYLGRYDERCLVKWIKKFC